MSPPTPKSSTFPCRPACSRGGDQICSFNGDLQGTARPLLLRSPPPYGSPAPAVRAGIWSAQIPPPREQGVDFDRPAGG